MTTLVARDDAGTSYDRLRVSHTGVKRVAVAEDVSS
jgi:hypothetical protein